MLCEFVNFSENVICYSLTGNTLYERSKEVSIDDILRSSVMLPFVLIFISWWSVPIILIDRKRPKSLGIKKILEKKRFKCGKK